MVKLLEKGEEREIDRGIRTLIEEIRGSRLPEEIREKKVLYTFEEIEGFVGRGKLERFLESAFRRADKLYESNSVFQRIRAEGRMTGELEVASRLDNYEAIFRLKEGQKVSIMMDFGFKAESPVSGDKGKQTPQEKEVLQRKGYLKANSATPHLEYGKPYALARSSLLSSITGNVICFPVDSRDQLTRITYRFAIPSAER